jgi:membrane protein YdbS with pleckstrin-like domain
VNRGLAPGEQVLVETRAHARRLAGPVLALPVIVGAASYAAAATPAGRLHSGLNLAELIVALGCLGAFCLRPYLAWRATRLVVSDRRVMLRSGVLRRRGRDLPVTRIADVTFDQRLTERVFRTGTLRVEPAGEGGALVIHDVPDVEYVHGMLLDLAGRTGREREVDR